MDFVDRFLFDQSAWCFPTQTGSEYEDVKFSLAEVLSVEAEDIAVVGSGKYGFSMAPGKGFNQFDPNCSDLDVVVISKGLFNSTWKHMRRAYFNGALEAKQAYQGDVFRRFVMAGTDDHLETTYLRDLRRLLDRARKVSSSSLGISQPIKFRVYSSWSDAKSYHIWSLQKLGEEHGIQ